MKEWIAAKTGHLVKTNDYFVQYNDDFINQSMSIEMFVVRVKVVHLVSFPEDVQETQSLAQQEQMQLEQLIQGQDLLEFLLKNEFPMHFLSVHPRLPLILFVHQEVHKVWVSVLLLYCLPQLLVEHNLLLTPLVVILPLE